MTGTLIALDWGTTNLRAVLLDDQGGVIEARNAISGVGEFTADQFAAHFDDVTAGWPHVSAIAAGMVGSRQGWQEAPYLPCPMSLDQLSQSLLSFSHDGRTIAIVPGLKICTPEHADVMRGEESQLAGLLTQYPQFSGTVILPGSHSKWVQVINGVIIRFQTYMTGELFNAISEHTILRHSIAPSAPSNQVFAEKCKQLSNQNGSIEGQLFSLRAQQLLEGTDPEELRQELSALLIMAEIRAALADGFELEDHTVLIGAEGLIAHYDTALRAHGQTHIERHDASLIWLALHALARSANLTGTSMS